MFRHTSPLFRENGGLIRKRGKLGLSIKSEAGPPLMYPLRVCRTNSHFLEDTTGKIVTLVGSHTWENNQAQSLGSFSWSTYISNLKTWGHTFIRLWVWEQSKPPAGSGASIVHPTATLSPEIWGRSTTSGANDGGNKFDLTTFNQNYFDGLRSKVDDCYHNGLYISIMLFNGWSVSDKGGSQTDPWPYHPFNSANNINSVNGDPNADGDGYEIQNNSNSTITGLQEDYVEKVIDSVSDYPNVLYEICNEADGSVSGTYGWIEHFVDHIKTYEANKRYQHPVIYTTCWPTGADMENQFLASSADIISVYSGYSGVPTAQVVMEDTDHVFGVGGTPTWFWKEFTWGATSVIYMDPWNNDWLDFSGGGHPSQDNRNTLGYLRDMADRVDMAHMQKSNGLYSTFCGVGPISSAYHQYFGFQDSNANMTVDLGDESGSVTFNTRKVNVVTGAIDTAQTVLGGATRTLTQPTGWTSGWGCWLYPQGSV